MRSRLFKHPRREPKVVREGSHKGTEASAGTLEGSDDVRKGARVGMIGLCLVDGGGRNVGRRCIITGASGGSFLGPFNTTEK